jgi:hypothetical protein
VRGSNHLPMAEEVDIRGLKGFVASHYGSGSLLRRVLAAEPDRLPAEEFLGKLGTWLAILREEAA